MNRPQAILRWSLLAGAVYFFLVSIAHVIGIKLPGLFIYFNVPSYQYQDRIISFLSFGWAVFLFSGFKNTGTVKYIILAGIGAIFGLLVINVSTDFTALSGNINPNIYWLETIALFGYLFWIILFYFLAERRQ